MRGGSGELAEPFSPVPSFSRKKINSPALDPAERTVAVEFDFMKPLFAHRDFVDESSQLGI
jgi:hypothetical protein